MADVKVLVLLGSLRAASVNRQLAELAIETAPAGCRCSCSTGWASCRSTTRTSTATTSPSPCRHCALAAAEADAALVVTPEYNGSIPGVLKNAIDWLSRPFGNGALKGKPLAVIGTALGQYGGVWAHDETRKSFGIAGPRVVEDLKLSIPSKVFDGKHPRENAEVVRTVRDVVGKLVAEVG